MFSHADLKPVKLQLPTSHDDRSIEWATKMHRHKSRTTTVGGRSKHGNIRSHAFVNTNSGVDAKIDSPPATIAAKRRRGKGRARHLRDLAYA